MTANARPDVALPFAITGLVIHGDHRGRELGFPTANVLASTVVDAPEGVFAGVVERADGSAYRAAISIGRRETFYGEEAPSLVEAHLIGFAGDLYDECLTVVVSRMLREQERFSSIEDLIHQIELDVTATRRLVPLPATSVGEPSPSAG